MTKPSQILRLSSSKRGSRRVTVYQWETVAVRVYDDAGTALKVADLFQDDKLTIQIKERILLRLLFVDPVAVCREVPDFDAFIRSVLWSVCGLDVDGTHRKEYGKKVMDWKQDDERIRASLYATYGKSFDELKQEFPLSELCSLIGLVPHDTPMGMALYYRTAKPPKATKHNQEQVREFNRMRRFYALKKGTNSDEFKNMNQAATAAFSALRGGIHA